MRVVLILAHVLITHGEGEDIICLAWSVCEATPKRILQDFSMRQHRSTFRSLTMKIIRLEGVEHQVPHLTPGLSS